MDVPGAEFLGQTRKPDDAVRLKLPSRARPRADACIGWDEAEALLFEMAAAVDRREVAVAV